MPCAKRRDLIRQIEAIRGSRVICYVTGDRAPINAQIGDDAVRPIIALLREFGKVPKIDLFLYTKGGATDVPWRIVRQLRHHVTESWHALIPYRANSAGTLIAIGADEIVLSGEGELGPIDPSMQVKRQGPDGTVITDTVSVEDVMAYVTFLRKRGQLADEAAIAGLLNKLVDRVSPVSLGGVYRTHTHIRDVARRILKSRRVPSDADVQDNIVKTLTERVYAHGHAIGIRTAKELGLPVVEAAHELDTVMWDLLETYENDMKIREPIDAVSSLGTQDTYTEDVLLAVAETAMSSYEFRAQLHIKGKRAIPQQLNVSLKLNLQLPTGADQSGAPQQQRKLLDVLLQQVQQSALQQAQTAVQQALNAQAPITSADLSLRGGNWRRAETN